MQQVMPGMELCDEDDPADCLWFLHDGELSARPSAGAAATLKAPALIGQAAILQEQSDMYYLRPCSYR